MASILELVQAANLENWINNHGGSVIEYPQTSTRAYDKAVKELTDKIKDEKITSDVKKALEKMYTVRRYYTRPILMSETRFRKIIKEFAESNFDNLEKFELFLITAAKIYHLKTMKCEYTDLVTWYKVLKDSNHDLTMYRIIALLQKRGIPLMLDVVYKLHSNPEELKKRIQYATSVRKNVEKQYMKLVSDLPFKPIENIIAIDRCLHPPCRPL